MFFFFFFIFITNEHHSHPIALYASISIIHMEIHLSFRVYVVSRGARESGNAKKVTGNRRFRTLRVNFYHCIESSRCGRSVAPGILLYSLSPSRYPFSEQGRTVFEASYLLRMCVKADKKTTRFTGYA